MKTITYTSMAQLDLSAGDLLNIQGSARHLNALEGITGLLVFNGTRFLQVIEGGEAAIDGLVQRLRRDDRHSAFEIRDQRRVERRSFPNWSMELFRVSTDFQQARHALEDALPPDVDPALRALVVQKAATLGGTISLSN